MKEGSLKLLLMRLMKAMSLDARLIAEVVVFLNKDDEKAAMILYLRDHPEATEQEILDIATIIMENSRGYYDTKRIYIY